MNWACRRTTRYVVAELLHCQNYRRKRKHRDRKIRRAVPRYSLEDHLFTWKKTQYLILISWILIVLKNARICTRVEWVINWLNLHELIKGYDVLFDLHHFLQTDFMMSIMKSCRYAIEFHFHPATDQNPMSLVLLHVEGEDCKQEGKVERAGAKIERYWCSWEVEQRWNFLLLKRAILWWISRKAESSDYKVKICRFIHFSALLRLGHSDWPEFGVELWGI